MSCFTFLSRVLRPPTNIPAESLDTCISLKLMRLCGLVSSDANGIYTFRPDLFRSLRKLENLVDDQMTKLGAQRVLLPTLGPRHLWEKSERWSNMQNSLFKLKDRLSHEYCLQPVNFCDI
uniref:Proline--tRNA ligase n=1 Tax=Trichobilharzia regenti TaxID=157069 RepID=A0AA85KAZ7_TRIRE|nr:unnamed protein product [Trichobilharzia regenti]